MEEKKTLCKSKEDKKLFGVCGGLAKYFNISSVWIRLIWAILSLFYGSGILIYLICALIIPEE